MNVLLLTMMTVLFFTSTTFADPAPTPTPQTTQTRLEFIININDSIINRSTLKFEGEENVEDSIINRNKEV